MTLKKAYNEIMERIEVTEEMRRHILENLEKADFKPSKKVLFLSNHKKYLLIAAGFAVLMVSTFMLSSIIPIEQKNPPPNQLILENDIREYTSAQELSKAVGFEFHDITELPFDVQKSIYIAYWKELAEIKYYGEEQTITVRKSIGSEDNSGDYTFYSMVHEITIDTNLVTIKGNEEKYNLAVWADNGYSYSIHLTNGISENELQDIILKIDGR